MTRMTTIPTEHLVAVEGLKDQNTKATDFPKYPVKMARR